MERMERIDYNPDTTRFWYGFFRVLYWIGIIIDTGGDAFCYGAVLFMLGPWTNGWYFVLTIVLSLSMSFITLALMKYKVLLDTGFVQTRLKMYSDDRHGMRADAILPGRRRLLLHISIWSIVVFRICTNVIALLQIIGKFAWHGDNWDAWEPELVGILVYGLMATIIVLWNMYGDAIIDTFLSHANHRTVQNENLDRPKGSAAPAPKNATTGAGTTSGAAAGSAYNTHTAHQPKAGM